MEEEKNPNEIIEIDENEEINNTQYDIEGAPQLKEVEKNPKNKHIKLSKKQWIIIIVSVVVLLIIVGILLYFLVFKKKDNTKNPEEPTVIVEKDNYRYENGFLVIIDEDKNELGKYECNNKNEAECYVAYYSSEDDFDEAKKVYEDGSLIQNRSDVMANNYVFIFDSNKKNDELILYNISDKKVEGKYDLVKEIDDNKVIVASNDKYSILTFSKTESKKLDNFKYDFIGHLSQSSNLVVATNKNYKLIDMDGNDISKTVPGVIKNYNDKNISVKISGNYYVYDYSGKVVSEEKYDYVKFVDNYALVVKNKKLAVLDSEGNKMNGEDIKISSDEYNSKFIFNKELRQVGKEVAFDAFVNGTTLKLEFDDETVNINLNEGFFNKKLSYVNYFAGKLYFYKDEEKKSLLGSYTCNYANAIGSETENLDNCFIAKESNLFSTDNLDNGYLPIYNERYVFIADTKSPNANDNIILWDLKQNKKMATYKMVDAKYHEQIEEIKHLKTAGNLVLAKNTNDSYGLINISADSINGVIGFKDEEGNINTSVKILDDNIIFKRSDDTYHLYNTKGIELASKLNTKNEIVEYKNPYVKVKSTDDIYMIYSTDGKVISSEAKYIIMENGYYILVSKDNNLEVYKYDDNTNLAPSDIKVDGKDFKKEINYGSRGSILVLTYILNNETNVVEIDIG